MGCRAVQETGRVSAIRVESVGEEAPQSGISAQAGRLAAPQAHGVVLDRVGGR